MTSMRAPATTATGHAPPSGAETQGVGRAPELRRRGKQTRSRSTDRASSRATFARNPSHCGIAAGPRVSVAKSDGAVFPIACGVLQPPVGVAPDPQSNVDRRVPVVTSDACRSAIAGDAWRTADDVCRALGVTSAIERARVSSALSHDAQRGLAEFRVVGWRKNRHVNAYRLRRDALSVAERCRIANEASHGGPMRPVLRDLCILAMQASPDREWSTPGLAETIGRKASGVLPALRQMRTDCLVQSRPVRVQNKYIELRWTLTDDGRAFEAKVQEFPKPDQPTPDRWPGRDHEALQDAWPHPVTIPMGGSARVHTMQGGWA